MKEEVTIAKRGKAIARVIQPGRGMPVPSHSQLLVTADHIMADGAKPLSLNVVRF